MTCKNVKKYTRQNAVTMTCRYTTYFFKYILRCGYMSCIYNIIWMILFAY